MKNEGQARRKNSKILRTVVMDSGTLLQERYEILAPLGAGGMGEVYRAKDRRLEREVAVKILPVDFTLDPGLVKRFQREATALASLNHPNIVVIHDFGKDHDVSFAVMELLSGETLRSVIRHGPLNWRRAVEIAASTAEGLAAAHSQRIIHRDIKPENIFLTAHGVVKILDFGLARLQEPMPDTVGSVAATISQTEVGKLIGTVPYMSPEQVRGKAVDFRTDLFSFGCVLYELISGFHPFSRNNHLETAAAILNLKAPRLSSHDHPAELEKIISRCLEKDPEKRFDSIQDLAAKLKKLLTDAETTKHKKKSHGTTTLPGAVKSLAILPFSNTGGNQETEYLADGITEAIINTVSSLSGLKVMARSTAFRFKGSTQSAQDIGTNLKVNVVLTGRITQIGETLDVHAELVNVKDGSQIWGERFIRKIEDIFRVQEDISREISQQLQVKLTGSDQKELVRRHTENSEAYRLYLKGRYWLNKRTQDALKISFGFFEQAVGADPMYALAYSGLADICAFLERYGVMPAKDLRQKANAAAKRAVELDPSLAETHTSLAEVSGYFEWNWKLAEDEFQKAIRLNPSYINAYHWYAWHLGTRMGRFDEARTLIDKALELDPLSLILNTNRGSIFYFERRYQDAVANIFRALELDPNFTVAHQWLGRAYEQMGLFDKAAEAHQKSVNLLPDDPESIASLAHTYAVAGRKGEARWLLKGLMEQRRDGYVSSYWIALVHVGLSEKEQAIDWLYRAYEDRFDWLGSLKLEPEFDSLRSEPRFMKLLTLMEL